MYRSSPNNVFRAFEQSSYNTKNEGKEGKILPEELFNALKNFAGDRNLPWYTLTANGVRFNQYVGAIQIGSYCVEVLPKIDKHSCHDLSAQRVLLEMLRQAGYISVQTPTESSLKLKQNYILEAYIRMFLDESWVLTHRGLVKYYHKEEGNLKCLKGSLLFNKHFHENIIHAERFYSRYSTYDRSHPLNRILYKTLKLIGVLPVDQEVKESAKAQIDLFPELEDISIHVELFRKLKYDRKTEAYRNAISIARLLLLNYHPDLAYGRNNVLALMFDMNDVWETWFTRRLMIAARPYNGLTIRAQSRKAFWTVTTGDVVHQKPDIIIEIDKKATFIVDTKWKMVCNRPSEEDLRQMFAYNKLFCVNKAWLIYPGDAKSLEGHFFDSEKNGQCGLSFVSFLENGRLSEKGVAGFLKRLGY